MIIIGLKLALLGMLVVFIFLSFLIISMHVSSYLTQRFFPIQAETNSINENTKRNNLIPIFASAIMKFKNQGKNIT